MRVETRFYQWRWERFDMPPRDGGADHDEPRRRDLVETGETQPDQGVDTGVGESEDTPGTSTDAEESPTGAEPVHPGAGAGEQQPAAGP